LVSIREFGEDRGDALAPAALEQRQLLVRGRAAALGDAAQRGQELALVLTG
jgi:hypothetical protein